MNKLGSYYFNVAKNYPLMMKQYYLMAIEQKNGAAMFNLGSYPSALKTIM